MVLAWAGHNPSYLRGGDRRILVQGQLGQKVNEIPSQITNQVSCFMPANITKNSMEHFHTVNTVPVFFQKGRLIVWGRLETLKNFQSTFIFSNIPYLPSLAILCSSIPLSFGSYAIWLTSYHLFSLWD
jgi:hypothetical protein